MATSVTTGRALRYAGGSARGLLHQALGHCQSAAERHPLFGVFASNRPLYDRIMGSYEHRSNRAALRGPLDDTARRIVDVGCGTGHLLGLVVQRYSDAVESIVAVDLSQNMLDQARAFLQRTGWLLPCVSFQRSDCRALPLDDASCDLYVSSYMLDMLPDIELTAALKEMRRVLKPGSQALLLTMTLDLDALPCVRRMAMQITNGLYNAGYRNGRWNAAWRFVCSGYAPHCRPIDLAARMAKLPEFPVEQAFYNRVSVFPVQITYLRKSHDKSDCLAAGARRCANHGIDPRLLRSNSSRL